MHSGTDLRSILKLKGHKSSKTIEIYIHAREKVYSRLKAHSMIYKNCYERVLGNNSLLCCAFSANMAVRRNRVEHINKLATI